jgi:hypothetical protein
MRIRATKPKFWESKTIAQLDWATRLVLKGLESYVDDNGVGKDDLELIATNVFPRDTFRNPPETFRRLSEAISAIESVGLIVRYERNGERLLYIDDWKGLQRIDKPTKGRYPRPDGTLDYAQDVDRDSYGNPPEVSAPVREEQGNRGVEEKETSDPDGPDNSDPLDHITENDFPDTFTPIYPKAFEEWWQHYPRKDAKKSALEAWKRACKRATKQDLIDGAIRYADDPNRVPKFTKQPTTWLNGDCWLSDELPGDQKAVGGIEW